MFSIGNTYIPASTYCIGVTYAPDNAAGIDSIFFICSADIPDMAVGPDGPESLSDRNSPNYTNNQVCTGSTDITAVTSGPDIPDSITSSPDSKDITYIPIEADIPGGIDSMHSPFSTHSPKNAKPIYPAHSAEVVHLIITVPNRVHYLVSLPSVAADSVRVADYIVIPHGMS